MTANAEVTGAPARRPLDCRVSRREDEMHMTEVETHKARKAHRCEWCWQRIDYGTEYKRYRYYDGGEAATIKMHPECMEAMQEEAAYWGGDFEWTPGQERPKVNANKTANAKGQRGAACGASAAPTGSASADNERKDWNDTTRTRSTD